MDSAGGKELRTGSMDELSLRKGGGLEDEGEGAGEELGVAVLAGVMSLTSITTWPESVFSRLDEEDPPVWRSTY